MRSLRLLLPLAIIVILVFVGRSYIELKRAQYESAPKPPARIDEGKTLQAQKWHYQTSEGGKTLVEVEADRFSARENAAVVELEGLELKLHHKDMPTYDRVVCAKATFNTLDGVMYSDGDVEITRGIQEGVPPSGRLLKIQSSGVRYESKTGKASTERPAKFVFDRGSGNAVGADYDPVSKELHMRKDVELHWKGVGPKGKDMTVQAGELIYKEQESKVLMTPWSRLMRDTLTMNAAGSVVTLEEGVIRKVEAGQAVGKDQQPNRMLDYAAQELVIDFSEDGEIKTINGSKDAKLTSTSETAKTDITADRVLMEFDTSKGGSELTQTVALGKTTVFSKPIPKAGALPTESKLLKSEVVKLRMRPGGQYLETVVTEAPGTLEFLPNRPGQRKRQLQGDVLTMIYADRNELQTFKATNVSTRTENEPKKGQTSAPPSLTWSKDLLATFDPTTGQMTRLEQWQDFRYEEGPRKAKADKAILEQQQDLMTLDGKARIWDETGSTTGDKILLFQKTNEMNADGNVVSVRLPDQKPGKKKQEEQGGSLLAQDEPMQAKAVRMTSRDNNQKLRYEGNAIVWQGVNRVQADTIDIDRKNSVLQANGKVISQFVESAHDEKDKPGTAKKPEKKAASPVFTVIKAPEMTYSDKEKVALYKGGVVLNRPSLDVKSQQLRAFLKQQDGGDSSLDHAFADGKVEIFQRAPDRTRQGFGEHAEYYVENEKIFLEGGDPQLIDSVRGVTKGKQLTYFANDDRLIVNGATSAPSESRIRRSK